MLFAEADLVVGWSHWVSSIKKPILGGLPGTNNLINWPASSGVMALRAPAVKERFGQTFTFDITVASRLAARGNSTSVRVEETVTARLP
jgi:hypothetical protein